MSIESNNTKEVLENIYESDKKSFDEFVDGKSKQLDYYSLKRLVLSELAFKNHVTHSKICGFTRRQILNMIQYPERYGRHIIRLMDYVYLKSGYVKRLIDYFCNMAKANYYVDTEILSPKLLTINETTLRNNYIKFCAQSSKYNLSNNINQIMQRLYRHDTCYAYVVETDVDISYFFLDPRYCEIKKLVNGNIYEFAINRSLINDYHFESLPAELQNLINQSYKTSKNHLVDIPYDKSLCIKYNDSFTYTFPPFFPMIADVLLVDEYKDLAKSQAVNDAYKLLVLKLPTKDGKLTMGDDVTLPFISTALQTIQENIGVLPVPFDVDSVEFAGSNSDDRDKVSDAITWTFKAAGVSEALMSGASSGSELNLSITNDSGDVFKIYRMLENWVSLQQKMRGMIYASYQFVYKLLDVTTFNRKDIIDQELKLAQAGLPNKSKLCATAGISPGAVIGNTIIEQQIFQDIFGMWQPLKTSYTQSGDETKDNPEGGAPKKDDADISEVTETQRENDSNDPDNRI